MPLFSVAKRTLPYLAFDRGEQQHEQRDADRVAHGAERERVPDEQIEAGDADQPAQASAEQPALVAQRLPSKGEPAQAVADLGQGGALLGDALILLGALCWVTYTLAAARFRTWSPLRFTVLTCIPGAIGLVAANVIAVAAGFAAVPSAAQAFHVGWQIVYLSVCTVVLGVLGFNAAAKRLGPLNTMLMLNLVPVGVFGIEAALGRSFAPVELAGATLVIGALAANNLYLRGLKTSR